VIRLKAFALYFELCKNHKAYIIHSLTSISKTTGTIYAISKILFPFPLNQHRSKELTDSCVQQPANR